MYSEDLKNSYPIFDTHAHYDDERFDDIREELFCEMQQNGVYGIVTCGCDEVSSKKAIKLAEDYDFVYAAVGIHPGNIDSGTTIEQIKSLATHPKCVAIGEIGLDYYWVKDNKDLQIEIFENQLMLAKKLNLPVIVHDRDAHQDTMELLKKHKPKGVLHCFSGSVETAKEVLRLGMYIGFGGALTFKNARKALEVADMLPLDRLLLETDCPYMAPVPMRGKRNDSSLIPYVAEKMAEIKNTDAQSVLDIATKNTKKLFNI